MNRSLSFYLGTPVIAVLLFAVILFPSWAEESSDDTTTEDWRKERWVVEPFTAALGGGPEWGPVEAVGLNLQFMVADRKGNLFIDCASRNTNGRQRIDIVTPNGIRYPLAGTGEPGFQDGPAAQAQFNLGENAYYGYSNLSVDGKGNVFVADSGNKRVRRVFENEDGKWMVETYVGGGSKSLQPGESCPPKEATLGSTIMVAAAPNGILYIATTNRPYIIDAEGKSIKALAWPKSISRGRIKFNCCGAQCDKNGIAYFGARTTDVVCRITPDGTVTHIAGATILKKDKESSTTGDRAPPIKANFDTPSSFFVDWEGECAYICGGDEYDVRRVPTDMKTTTATLMMNGKWYICDKHPNNNRGPKPRTFDPDVSGKLTMHGGKVSNLCVTPLVGIDAEGNLYGKLNSWSGASLTIKGKGLVSTHVFKIRRVKEGGAE